MTAARRRDSIGEASETLHEEMAWLAGYRMTAERIAGQLGVKVDTVHAHAAGRRGGAPFEVYAEPVPDLPVPAHFASMKTPRRNP